MRNHSYIAVNCFLSDYIFQGSRGNRSLFCAIWVGVSGGTFLTRIKGWYHKSYRWLEERGKGRGSWKMESGPFKNQFAGLATLYIALIVDMIRLNRFAVQYFITIIFCHTWEHIYFVA